MDSKTKAKVQGILIGSGLVAFLIFLTKLWPECDRRTCRQLRGLCLAVFLAGGRGFGYCGQGETTSWRRSIERVLNCWNVLSGKINKSLLMQFRKPE